MCKFLVLTFLLAAVGSSAAAGEKPHHAIVLAQTPPDSFITVLATGTRGTIYTSGQPIAIVEGDEVDAVQGGDIARVLDRTPGLSFSRNGGPGAFTGLSLRGAGAEQLLVLIDGVRVADTASPGGGFDFGTLLPAGIGKIEILRGSNGTVWGSQAIGGVLAAWSDTRNGVSASAEYGARDTIYGTTHAGIEAGPLQLSANGAWYRTDGFSAAASGIEPDGFRHWQLGGNGRLGLTSELSLHAGLRYADGRLDIDGFPAPTFTLADTAEYQKTRQLFALTGFEYAGDRLRLGGDWSSADTQRYSFDPATGSAPTYSTDGHSDRLDLKGLWQVGDTSLWFGGEKEWSQFADTYDAPKRARSSGAYAQIGHRFGELSFNAGARIAERSRFGGATTFGADASWAIGGGWRLRASFGEGFKAPTLFQLFSDYGNVGLRPERSTSVDLGIELNDRNEGPHLAATVFRRKSEGLIDFVSCFNLTSGICENRPFGTYDNVGRARAQGLELEARQEVLAGVTARLAYSFVDTENRTPASPDRGKALVRRPRQVLSGGVEWEIGHAGGSIAADLRWSSASFDDAANTVRLSPYAVLDLTARWPLNDTVELYGRVENVRNESYQTAAGYASPPRGLFAGARMRL